MLVQPPHSLAMVSLDGQNGQKYTEKIWQGILKKAVGHNVRISVRDIRKGNFSL